MEEEDQGDPSAVPIADVMAAETTTKVASLADTESVATEATINQLKSETVLAGEGTVFRA